MFHISIGNSCHDTFDPFLVVIQTIQHLFSESSALDIFFHGHDHLMIFTGRKYCLFVNGLDKSGIDDTCLVTLFMQKLLDFLRCLYHTAYGKQCDTALSCDPLRLAQFNGGTVFGKSGISRSSGISHRNGRIQCHGKLHHIR